MISVWVEQIGSQWFGVAEHEATLVATVTGETRDRAIRSLLDCLPTGAPHQMTEQGSPYARSTAKMLADIESGNESGKHYELSATYVPQTIARVLRAAAAIPLGYVSTYGAIAAVAGTNARVVGRTMATNPLYPIVPCHRVVGADLALVGYGGRTTPLALDAKLNRLRAEARGYPRERTIGEAGGLLVVPVERVIQRAASQKEIASQQLTLW